eukprot:COSAG05_NODE_50_length_24118_cov_89.534036_11_plen_73_part_00
MLNRVVWLRRLRSTLMKWFTCTKARDQQIRSVTERTPAKLCAITNFNEPEPEPEPEPVDPQTHASEDASEDL